MNSGRVTAVEGLDDPMDDLDNVGILLPRDQLVQLVFGFRDLGTLIADHYDCWANNSRAHAVLAACFPRTPSSIWPIGLPHRKDGHAA